jgi:TetR/AcrR family transcriptional repressor of bet genes
MPGQKASETLRRQQILKAAHDVALRQGIDGLTVRAVAARARLSHGLVLFHFKRKNQLVSALLDRVLAAVLSLHVADEVAHIGNPLERLRALLRQEVNRLSRDHQMVRLFLEYWALGNRNSAIRVKIRAALERYRGAFRVLAEDVLRTEGAQFPGLTSEGLAAIAVSFINGCAVQAMIDPDRFDIEEYLVAVQGIGGQFPLAA